MQDLHVDLHEDLSPTDRLSSDLASGPTINSSQPTSREELEDIFSPTVFRKSLLNLSAFQRVVLNT